MNVAWLGPPIFPNDQLDYVGRIFHAALLSTVILVVIAWFLLVSLVPGSIQRFTVLSLFSLVIAAALLLLNRRTPILAGTLTLIMFWLIFTGAIFGSGGIHGPLIFVYFVLIVACTLTFSRRASLFMLFVTSVAILSMAWTEVQGELPKPLVAHTPYSIGAIWVEGLAFLFVIVAVASNATRGYLEKRLAAEMSLQDANAALDRSLQVLSSRMEQLEYVHKAAGLASAVWDNRTNRVEWFGDINAIMGMTGCMLPLTTDEYASRLHPDDMSRAKQRIRDGLKGVRPSYRDEERVVLKDGSIRWLETEGKFEYGADGRAMRLAGIVYDVTERRNAREIVAASERRYRELFDSALDGIVVVSPDGVFIDVNPTCCMQTGFTREEMVGHSIAELLLPEDLQKQPIPKDMRVAQGVAITERRIKCKDGSLLPVEINRWNLPDGNVQAILRNVSERKRAEERFAQIFELAPNPIVITKFADRKIVEINQAFEKIFGYSKDECIGRTGMEVGINTNPNARDRLQRDVAASRSIRGLEASVRRKSGTFADIVLDADLMEIDGENYMISSAIDVTDRKRAEMEIRELNTTLEQRVQERTRELEESNRDMESFTYTVSHDLRAPLRRILSFAHMMNESQDPAISKETRHALARIDYNAKRMSVLIDDLLAFSKVGKGPVARRRVVDMRAEVAGLIEEFNLADKVELGEIPNAVCDPSLLRQVWQNLILNAVKFSANVEAPKIQIRGSRLADGQAQYSVQDNGVGFDMAYADKLFTVFQRLHSESQFEGTGVGLAIVHRIISRHGGQISAQSAPGKGATFTFTLPDGEQAAS